MSGGEQCLARSYEGLDAGKGELACWWSWTGASWWPELSLRTWARFRAWTASQWMCRTDVGAGEEVSVSGSFACGRSDVEVVLRSGRRLEVGKSGGWRGRSWWERAEALRRTRAWQTWRRRGGRWRSGARWRHCQRLAVAERAASVVATVEVEDAENLQRCQRWASSGGRGCERAAVGFGAEERCRRTDVIVAHRWGRAEDEERRRPTVM